jgi:DNA-binding MarR family transcriptional regulator
MSRDVAASAAMSPRGKGQEKAAPNGGDVSLGPLETFIAFNLRLAQDASFQVFAQHSGAPHLRPGRFASLMVISQNPGLTQAELGRAIARDKSTVTPLVQSLQRDGLVERRPSTTDRRSVTLWLTEAGETVTRSLIEHAREHDRKLDAIVGAKKPELLRLLKKIVAELS